MVRGGDPMGQEIGLDVLGSGQETDDHVDVARSRALKPGTLRRMAAASVAGVVAVGLVASGFVVGASSAQPQPAEFDALYEGIGVALGMSSAEVQEDRRRYHQSEWDGCARGTCRRVDFGPVSGPGESMLARLYSAGWVLHSHDGPECVSDGPDVSGWICSYELDDVTVSIQVESPQTPGQLYLWASTG